MHSDRSRKGRNLSVYHDLEPDHEEFRLVCAVWRRCSSIRLSLYHYLILLGTCNNLDFINLKPGIQGTLTTTFTPGHIILIVLCLLAICFSLFNFHFFDSHASWSTGNLLMSEYPSCTRLAIAIILRTSSAVKSNFISTIA
jgi:hypothetical protein